MIRELDTALIENYSLIWMEDTNRQTVLFIRLFSKRFPTGGGRNT
jgi:hypothetical protein